MSQKRGEDVVELGGECQHRLAVNKEGPKGTVRSECVSCGKTLQAYQVLAGNQGIVFLDHQQIRSLDKLKS